MCTGMLSVAEGLPEVDEPPKPDYKPPPVAPKEEKGTGANKKTYFVSNGRKFSLTKKKRKNNFLFEYFSS